MTPGRLDLPVIWRRCDWPAITLTWKDQDGDPIDLTGWSPTAKTRNFNLNPRITDAVNGVTTLSLTPSVTSTLRLGIEQWDWIWIDPDGTPLPPFLAGGVEIKQGPTIPEIQT